MRNYNARFSGTLEATALVALFTIISAATRSFIVTEIDVEGMGTSSAAQEAGIYRVGTAGVTGGGAVTPVPTDASSTAFGGTAFASYATQPIKGALVHNVPINANGQRYFWRCNPNLNNCISVPGGAVAAGSLGVFTLSGTGVLTGRLQVVEF